MFILAKEKANSGRTVKLVTRGDIEITIKRLNVDRQMHRALTSINENFGTRGVRKPDDFGKRRYGAEHVGHMRHGDQLRLRGEEFGEGRNVKTVVRPYSK